MLSIRIDLDVCSCDRFARPLARSTATCALRRPRPASRCHNNDDAAHGGSATSHRCFSSDVEIRAASTAAELRAAAHLRAAAFYSYPLDRSEFSARSHRRMKTNEEWEILERKTSGTAHDWQSIAVTCLIAVIDEGLGDAVAAAVAEDLDASCRLPAECAGTLPQLVVGTLDINQGARLPSEELIGREPAAGAGMRRAYLSNVCVPIAARRQGVAARMIETAKQLAAAAGVEQLYVHVRTRNAAALALYHRRSGFAIERRETETEGHKLGRPSRVLLRCAV